MLIGSNNAAVHDAIGSSNAGAAIDLARVHASDRRDWLSVAILALDQAGVDQATIEKIADLAQQTTPPDRMILHADKATRRLRDR